MLVLFFLLLAASCATQRETQTIVSAGESVTVQDIKNAIARQQQAIKDVIPARSRIAVLDIDSYDNELGIFATEEIIMLLVKARRFSVVDRDNIETLRKEQNFQSSGAVSDETAVAIGKFIGAGIVITGKIQQRYGQVDFSLKILTVETAEIIDLISIPLFGVR
jgi:curli biogenesis system outer membrane secretion channel CsgG